MNKIEISCPTCNSPIALEIDKLQENDAISCNQCPQKIEISTEGINMIKKSLAEAKKLKKKQ